MGNKRIDLKRGRKRNSGSKSQRKRRQTEENAFIIRKIIDDLLENVHLSTLNLSKNSNPTCTGLNVGTNNNTDDEYDFTWGSVTEYNRIRKCPLEIGFEEKENLKRPEGYRIVEIDFFLQQTMLPQHNHSKVCTASQLLFEAEKRRGLSSTFTFKCNGCDKEYNIYSEKPTKKFSVVNTAAVWGTLSTGGTYSHTSELLSILDIPPMPGNMFFEIQRRLGYVWKESLWEELEETGKEEKRMALENNHIDKTGIPYITVLVDGGWSKRSYGHSYNAASGVAVVIGRNTGKLLYLGVRNKFCSICARAEHQNQIVKEHVCFKNWSGSSAGMEADIVVDGFNSSIEMHGLKYIKFIADGDSSVFARIKKDVTYGTEVSKIECTNHAIKNYSKHLYRVRNDTKSVALEVRKLLTRNVIHDLVSNAHSCVYANAHGDVKQLKDDIRNSVKHSFGDHSDCKKYMCNTVGDTSGCIMNTVIKSGAHHHIYGAINSVLLKSDQLIDNETNNRAELFMSILARFNMGKRLNLIQRDSFQTREYLTGMRYNRGPSWHREPWKKVFQRSPGKNVTMFIKKDDRKRKRESEYVKPKYVKKLKFSDDKAQKLVEYGPYMSEINITDGNLKEEVEKLISRLRVSKEEQKRLAQETVGQFDNPRYVIERQYRLTASNFGDVWRRQPKSQSDKLVLKILRSSNKINVPSINYGIVHEKVAISKFEEVFGKKVIPSGLYIDSNNGFLGASPDGIIDDTEIVEVKCLYSVAKSGMTLQEYVQNKKAACLEVINNEVHLKKKHNYYFQIQGQLAITGAEICNFIVYSGDNNDLFVEKIHRDNYLWQEDLLPKLIKFYFNWLGPEIILNNRKRKKMCIEHKIFDN